MQVQNKCSGARVATRVFSSIALVLALSVSVGSGVLYADEIPVSEKDSLHEFGLMDDDAELDALTGDANEETSAFDADLLEPLSDVESNPIEEGIASLSNIDRTVYVPKSGKGKYHYSAVCSGMKNPVSLSLRSAISRGYEPCGTCVDCSSDDPAAGDDEASSKLTRLHGPIALDTMRAITLEGFAAGSSPYAIVATTDGYWDALTAAGLAGLSRAPVLLTDKQSLSSQTEQEIRRLRSSCIYIAGGPAAVSEHVVNQIRSIAGVAKVERFAGNTATSTAVELFRKVDGWGDTAIVATSGSFQDALSVAPYAYANHAPILLAESGTGVLSDETLQAIRSSAIRKVYIVGGVVAVSPEVESQLGGLYAGRLSGPTAYETSNEIATWCVSQGMQVDGMGIATGESYYDALAGAALCGKNNAALVLVADNNRTTVDSFIGSYAPNVSTAYVFGGPAAVSPDTFNAIASCLE